VYFFVEGLQDYYNNTVPTKKFTLTSVADSVATLTKSEAVSESSIELTFDKAINTDTVSTSNVTLKNSSGTAVSLNTINYVAADKKIVIGFDTQAGGNYTVTFSNLKTTTGNVISTQTVTVAITDKTAISSISINAVDAGATGDYAIIKFPESMATTGSFSIGDKSKYSVDVDGVAYAALASADTLTVVDDKTVKIAFTGNKFAAAQVLNARVTLVADKAGNINGSAVTGSGTVLASGAKLDLSADVTAVKITDLRTIKVVVNRLMNAVSASDFRVVNVTDSNAEIYPAQVTYANEADGTGTATITITVSNDLDTAKTYKVKTATVGGTKDASDLLFAPTVTTASAADNYIAPNLKSVSVIDSTTLRLVFDKLLVIKTGGDFTVKVGDTAYTTSTLTQVTGPVYDLAVAAFDINATPVVRTIAAPQSEDSFGNKLVANTTGITAKNARVQKIVLSKGAVAGTIGADETIAITFDTAIDPASISGGWTGSSALTAQTVAGDDSSETLDIAGVGIVTFTGDVVDQDFTHATAKYELSADKKTLTVTLIGAVDADIAAAGGGYQAAFEVANTVKNSDGTYYNAGDSIITGSSLK
jgi:hypothetical protein